MSPGIEKLRIYPCSMALRLDRLCAARGGDPAYLRDSLMVQERAVNPPWEDPVTMAVNAAGPMLTDDDRERIELLIVGTESGVDQEKSISTWIHRHLGLKQSCRNFEIKHACYAATAGLQMALSWLGSGQARGAKALIIGTDQSLMHLNEPYEYVLGAGAAAVLVSQTPDLLEIEPGMNGYWTQDVADLMRPTSRIEAGDRELSLACYLDALEGAYAHYRKRAGDIDVVDHFQRLIFHMPFAGMAFLAHKTLLGDRLDRSAAREDFERRTAPGLRYSRRMGATYGSSTFVALQALLEGDPDLRAGDRIGIFSYGSGACAEFYSGLVGEGVRAARETAETQALFDGRHQLSIDEYEEIERERTTHIDLSDYEPSCTVWYDEHYAGKGLLVFRGLRAFHRQYERS